MNINHELNTRIGDEANAIAEIREAFATAPTSSRTPNCTWTR
jgi:hypothetical protein